MIDRNKFSIVTTMAPRLEIYFVEEWLKYHLRFVKRIIIFCDKREKLLDRYFDPPGHDGSFWSKKPSFQFFNNLDHQTLCNDFQEICKSYKGVELFEGASTDNVSANQCLNILNSLHMIDTEWCYHIDCDEFLKIDNVEVFKENHVGIVQYIMDDRSNINDHKSISCITKSKGDSTLMTPFNYWKTCYNMKRLRLDLKRSCVNKLHPLIHGWELNSEIKAESIENIKLFHYVGWHHRRHSLENAIWESLPTIDIQEFQIHFESQQSLRSYGITKKIY